MVDIVNEGKTVAVKESFADLNILMTPHPITGDITLKTDAEAIKRSVRNIVMTNFYERPFKPNLGTSLRNQLFELNDLRVRSVVSKRVKNSLEKLEPRISDVQMSFGEMDSNNLYVTIFYTIRNSQRTQEVEFTVKRVR